MYKKLLSDSAIYGLGAVLIKAIAFFTLPVYTRIFSPSEFGIIEMFSTIGGIFSMLMNSGLDSAQSFYFMEAKNRKTYDTKQIIGSIFWLRVFIGIGIIGLIGLLSPFIIDFAFDTRLPSLYLITVSFTVFFTNLVSQSIEIFRLIYKPWQYITLSFAQTILNVIFILYFVYFKDMGVWGYLLGNAVGIFIATIICLVATNNYRYWKSMEFKLWKMFLKFGLPFIPAGIVYYIMTASDRWFILNMIGGNDLGLYAVGVKFALLIMLVIETFRQAWWPLAIDMLYKDREGKKFFKNISLWYMLIGAFCSMLLTIISPYLVEYLTTKEYKQSWKVIGILCWGSVFYGFYMLSGMGIFYSKKTYLNIYVYGSGAILNIALNYILIPIFGIIGAAFGTILSVLFSNIVSLFISNHFYKVDWHWFYMLIIVIFGISFNIFYIFKF